MSTRPLLGITIGGRGRRMGGVQKALLRAPDSDETLVARLVRLAAEAELDVVLLGRAELGDSARGVLQLPDALPDAGPLLGLRSLLTYAGGRSALCLACDMPYVTCSLLVRLRDEVPDATVLAPRDPASRKWEPLFARYASAQVEPVLRRALASGERSFQQLFTRLSVTELALDPDERALLRDWDSEADMA
ncbi:MAG: NTP transferase domain-containing protein [Polyangiales bacterium]